VTTSKLYNVIISICTNNAFIFFNFPGPFTVLAPSNAAFNENPELLKTLFNPKNSEALQELLLYHVVPGFFLGEDLVSGPLQTLLGEEVDVAVDPLKFNQALAIQTDILSCNGVIDIIDDILIPPGKNAYEFAVLELKNQC